MGIWDSLTAQGKLAVAAVLILAVAFYVLASGGNSPNRPSTLGVLPTPAPGSPTATIGQPLVVTTAGASVTPANVGPQTTPSPTPQATTPPAATATVAPPAPTQPPSPPTATTAPVATGCAVSASASASPGNDTATARLVCDGSGVQGAPMTALFTYQSTSGRCTAAGDSSGTASCRSTAPASAGALASVSACFGHMGQLYCGNAMP